MGKGLYVSQKGHRFHSILSILIALISYSILLRNICRTFYYFMHSMMSYLLLLFQLSSAVSLSGPHIKLLLWRAQPWSYCPRIISKTFLMSPFAFIERCQAWLHFRKAGFGPINPISSRLLSKPMQCFLTESGPGDGISVIKG